MTKMNDAIKGFKDFDQRRKIKFFNAVSMDMDGMTFDVDNGRLRPNNVTALICALLEKCSINGRIPFHLQEDADLKPTLGRCLTCRNQGMVECFFHEKCAKIHKEGKNYHDVEYFDLISYEKDKRAQILHSKLDFKVNCTYNKWEFDMKLGISYSAILLNTIGDDLIDFSGVGIGLAIGIELCIFGVHTYNNVQDLMADRISMTMLLKKESLALLKGSLSVGANVAGIAAGAAIGAAVGTAVWPVGGSFIGAIAGLVAGIVVGVFGNFAATHFVDWLGATFFGVEDAGDKEVTEKAVFFTDAMMLLETRNVTEIDSQHINQCFR